jgi:hypothetical protein
MEQLSGGEKTVAALALLFAIHRSVPPSNPSDSFHSQRFILYSAISQPLSSSSMKSMPHLTTLTSPKSQTISAHMHPMHSNLSLSV